MDKGDDIIIEEIDFEGEGANVEVYSNDEQIQTIPTATDMQQFGLIDAENVEFLPTKEKGCLVRNAITGANYFQPYDDSSSFYEILNEDDISRIDENDENADPTFSPRTLKVESSKKLPKLSDNRRVVNHDKWTQNRRDALIALLPNYANALRLEGNDYYNRQTRSRIWCSIANKIDKTGEINANDVRSLFNSLRSQWKSIHSKVVRHYQQSGVAGGKQIKPHWPHYYTLYSVFAPISTKGDAPVLTSVNLNADDDDGNRIEDTLSDDALSFDKIDDLKNTEDQLNQIDNLCKSSALNNAIKKSLPKHTTSPIFTNAPPVTNNTMTSDTASLFSVPKQYRLSPYNFSESAPSNSLRTNMSNVTHTVTTASSSILSTSKSFQVHTTKSTEKEQIITNSNTICSAGAKNWKQQLSSNLTDKSEQMVAKIESFIDLCTNQLKVHTKSPPSLETEDDITSYLHYIGVQLKSVRTKYPSNQIDDLIEKAKSAIWTTVSQCTRQASEAYTKENVERKQQQQYNTD